MDNQKQRILIIGAGPSGLSLLRAFQSQRESWENNIEVVCIEKQSQWGGQWNYITNEIFDENGIPIPSTNQYLWTNAPKQCFQYPDYSFDKHFNGVAMPSYLPRKNLRSYVIARFQQSHILKYIKFMAVAKNIRFQQNNKKFTVQIKDLKQNKQSNEHFDYVVIASGHYSKPNLPQVPGLKQFKGKLLHSIQIKDYQNYKGDRVLIIGAGLSAEDAILQCYKYGSKQITVTYRTKPMSQKFPQSIEQLPLLTRVQGNKVFFKNDKTKQFDTIIMCTGYTHNFTFLNQQLHPKSSSMLWNKEMYMGAVFINNQKLLFIGMQTQYFSFMMFDIQSYYVRDTILKKIQLPNPSDMKADNLKRLQKVNALQSPYDMIRFMGEYLRDLIKITNYRGYQLDKVIQLYNELQKHKESNILTFRDNIYQSSVTGTWSIMRNQLWLKAGSSFENGELGL